MATEIGIAIVSGMVGGLISATAAIFAYAHGYLSIERIERRKHKLSINNELMASRYVLSANYEASAADARDFNRAISSIPHAFADNREVIVAYDDFVATKDSAIRTEKLLTLLGKIGKAAGVSPPISPSHLRGTLAIPSGRR